MKNYKNVIASTKCVAISIILALFLAACDDSSSGAGPEPVAEVSSSSTTRHCEEQTEGCDEAISSSSVTDKGTSSGGGSVSSWSEKSSSSTDAKSSSSSSLVLFESSSSLSKQLRCLLECTDDCEGETYWQGSDYQMICHDGLWLNLDSMEQANAPSSSSYFDMTEQFNPDVKYGEFTDPRDGKKYRTVELKNGVFMESYTVFAENLNYGKMISGGSVQEDSTKYCYDDDPWYCENGWGGLYTWSRAMNFPAVCDSFSVASEKCPNKFNLESDNEEFNGKYYFVQHQGICPEGWHIMNENEWVEISEKSSRDVALYMGSKVAGFGTNDYGLSILPAGYWIDYGNEHNKFYEIKVQSNFWMPQQADTDLKAYMTSVSRKNFSRNFPVSKKYGNSIRCVKNY